LIGLFVGGIGSVATGIGNAFVQLLSRPDQYRAIGWVKGRLYSLILEIRNDKDGEYYHLVTLWKSTRAEQKLYEENL